MLDLGTNKRGLIVYGGESSADYGMVVSEAPSFERGARKQTVYKVPGRSGSVIIQQDAWEDVNRSYKVWIAAEGQSLPDMVNAIDAWLNSLDGYQRLEDNFEPDVYRLAYYSGGTEFSNMLMAAGESTLKFTCRAERFYKEWDREVELTSGTPLYNPTRFASKPLLYIEGSGEVKVTVGSKTITATITDYIYIDCEAMNAYRTATENMNDKISGPFPLIAPGANSITLTGSITKATAVPRYFTI